MLLIPFSLYNWSSPDKALYTVVTISLGTEKERNHHMLVAELPFTSEKTSLKVSLWLVLTEAQQIDRKGKKERKDRTMYFYPYFSFGHFSFSPCPHCHTESDPSVWCITSFRQSEIRFNRDWNSKDLFLHLFISQRKPMPLYHSRLCKSWHLLVCSVTSASQGSCGVGMAFQKPT